MEETTEFKIDLTQPPKIGTLAEGKIIGIGRSASYVDLGCFGTGIIYGKEFKEAKSALKDLNVGDMISAKITNLETEEGFIELSLKEAREEIVWKDIEEKKEKGELIKVRISGANKGGLLTQVFDISGFLPVSQLSSENYPRVEDGDPGKILKELQKFIGEEIEVKILDFSQKENKLILSEKAKEIKKVKDALKNYAVGDIVEGKVTAILNFGDFVKFGKDNKNLDLEGLIHISELDWKLIEDPSKTVKVDQEIKVKIINIENERIFLSLKALKEDPWKSVEEKYKKRDIIKGKVVKFKPFGALIQITPEIQGLIHISEFGSQNKMEEILKIEEEYDFKISLVKADERKIILEIT